MTRIEHRNADGSPRYTNRLSRETSPYLLQHAHNPVDWYAWGPEAFEQARLAGKPLHLSVGYSACHWCHVLAAESFEDEETARLLNAHFINVKVDREERPDVDRIYQIAQQLLTRRSGGWPLTMFLTHEDQLPFFGGTYFPREARFGLPAFKQVLQRVVEFYRQYRPQLHEQSAALIQAFDQLEPPPAGAEARLGAAPLAACRQDLAASFDRQAGGFGGAPKFPHPQALERLLRDWHAGAAGDGPDLHALFMVTLTLKRMGEGGINDQLGGGFCRYSVDESWTIPHFEKMLYDNGALLAVYAQAALATGDAFYAGIAQAIAAWAMREMRSPAGAFYSSLDADSEGHEGRFYVWDTEEVRQVLTAAEYAAFAPCFGLTAPANFEGHWHLQRVRATEDVARELAQPLAAVQASLAAACTTLLAVRARRVRPGRDDKILTSWNALMIRGLAIAARALQREDLACAATAALDFIRGTLWQDGRLLATASEDRAHLNAYLDDYAYLADAILELQQVRFRAEELQFARELLDVLLQHFADEKAGGFFFTADDHERLIHRPKSFADDATPAGNGVAACVLQRMGHLLGEPAYLQAAENTLRAAWFAIERSPRQHVSLLTALEELLTPAQIIILRGEAGPIEHWRQQLARLFAPNRLVLAIPQEATGLPPALAARTSHGPATAYICTGSTCSAPLESLPELLAALRSACAPAIEPAAPPP